MCKFRCRPTCWLSIKGCKQILHPTKLSKKSGNNVLLSVLKRFFHMPNKFRLFLVFAFFTQTQMNFHEDEIEFLVYIFYVLIRVMFFLFCINNRTSDSMKFAGFFFHFIWFVIAKPLLQNHEQLLIIFQVNLLRNWNVYVLQVFASPMTHRTKL